MSRHQRLVDTRAAHALGWASIGIGLAEIAAPRQVQHMMGLDDTATHRGVLRVLGLREVLHGVSILAEDRPSAALSDALRMRVVGDVLDTAVLGVAAAKTKSPASFAAVVLSVFGIGIMDTVVAARLERYQQ
ncbi:MAG TPA: hypothetical protein VGN72_07960 [Tepidisphaeraceae bacterium]|jgi:hypothetical protein|nr:hypothetical protein [Tepidisphaeraceae bacterium]